MLCNIGVGQLLLSGVRTLQLGLERCLLRRLLRQRGRMIGIKRVNVALELNDVPF